MSASSGEGGAGNLSDHRDESDSGPPAAPKPRRGVFFRFIIGLLAFAFAAFGVIFGYTSVYFSIYGPALLKEKQDFAEKLIRTIVSNWDAREIKKRASPELLANFKEADLDKVFHMASRLGKLKSVSNVRWDTRSFWALGQAKKVVAATQADAEFEAGPATISLGLIEQGGQWQITGFNFNSPVFLQTLDHETTK